MDAVKKILVTGFDPFGGEHINPAWEAVKLLPGQIDGVVVVTYQIPTVFGKSIDVLLAAIEKESPDAVICVGQAGGRPNITVERVAINCDDAPLDDNEGGRPADCPVVAGAPAAYFSTLPIKAMVVEMLAAGIPAAVSNTAGTFVCNHLMYGALHHAATQRPHMKTGFVHIPYLPQQTVSSPSMSVDNVVAGLMCMVKTIVDVNEDVATSGGATH
ncbi:MAG: pyroglutamyl-peptidase I [Defluviitaleaceae bacterium]|nr:pyroglutamyl-peptidase I [Defluviitaleaceae bacterium]